MALPPVSSTPSTPVTSAAASSPQELEKEKESPPVKLNETNVEKKSLSLVKAKALFDEIQARYPKYAKLSPAVLLEVDIFNRLYALKKSPEVSRLKAWKMGNPAVILKMDQLLDDAILATFILFRLWRRISLPDNPPKKDLLIAAQEALLHLSQHYNLISRILEQASGKYRQNLDALQDRMGILHHLAISEDFLDKALTPSSAEALEATITSETVQLLEEGLTMALYGLQHFKKHVDEMVAPAFKQTLQRLEKRAERHPELAPLVRSLNSYYTTTSEIVDFFFIKADLPNFLTEIQRDPLSKGLRQTVSQLVFLNERYVHSAGKVVEQFQPLYKKWEEKLPSTKESHLLVERLDFLEALILKQCEVLGKNADFKNLLHEIRQLVKMRNRTMDLKNSCCADTFRIPSLLMQQMNGQTQYFDFALNHVRFIVKRVKERYPQYGAIGVNLTDLIIQESTRLLKSLPQHESNTLLKKICNHIILLEAWDTPNQRDPERLESIVKLFVEELLEFNTLMKSLCQREPFAEILDVIAVLVPASKSPSFRKVELSFLNSSLYQNFTNRLDQKLTAAHIQFVQERLLQQIQTCEDLANGTTLASIKEILRHYPEGTRQPKEFWKLCLNLMDFLTKKVNSTYRLGIKMRGELTTWSTESALIVGLKAWMDHLDENFDYSAIAALGAALLNEASHLKDERGKKLNVLCETFALDFSFSRFLHRPFYHLIGTHDLLSSTETVSAAPKIKEFTPSTRPEVREEEEAPPTPTLELPRISLTPYENLQALQLRAPLFLDQEEPFSRFKRKEKMEHALHTHFYLLALLEEEKNDPALKGLFRDSTDLFRLLEMTEKLALAFLPIQGSKKKEHIILDPNQRHLLMHDGVKLAEVLSKVEPLFGNKKNGPFLRDQEKVLKVSYWFRAEMPPANEAYRLILPRCQEIWSKLVSHSLSHSDEGLVSNLRLMQRYVHKQQRQQPVFPIPADLPPLASLIASFEEKLPTLNREELKRVLALSKALHEHQKRRLSSPILFTNRHAEIQVSLLSTAMQSCLASLPVTIQTDQGLKHPLECDYEGKLEQRPLKHSHNVEHLLNTLRPLLKEPDDTLAEKLALFMGDPRYPYPNKSALSADLVTSFELSKLQDIIQTGFLNQESKQIFSRYFPGLKISSKEAKVAIEKKLEEHLERMERKTRFAFHIALEILKLKY